MIGAGIAGVTVAAELAAAGYPVTVLDKSPDIGGRLATRRRGGVWNHGAPAVQVRTAAFGRCLEQLAAAGSARRDAARQQPATWLGVPDMRELIRPLTRSVTLQLGCRVDALRRLDGRWRLEPGGEHFDVVVCTTPAPQAAALLADNVDPRVQRLAAALQPVTLTPAWVLLLSFDHPLALKVPDGHPLLAQAVPSPGQGMAGWAVHADAAWSARHLELDKAAATGQLLDAVRALPVLQQGRASVLLAQAHRWRYARTGRALGEPCLWDADVGLGLAGDWCLGANAEDAFTSAVALAGRVTAANAGVRRSA